MNNQNEKRQLLKDILSGKVKREEVRRQLGGPVKDLTLLTDNERKLMQLFTSRYENNRASCKPGASTMEQNAVMFQGFNVHELLQVKLLQLKATPEQPKRHLLDRVDLTTISQREASQANGVLTQPWVRDYTLPEWLQE